MEALGLSSSPSRYGEFLAKFADAQQYTKGAGTRNKANNEQVYRHLGRDA